MTPPGVPVAQPLQLDCFLQATMATERNSMDLDVPSVLARLGQSPWADAARLAGLPRDAAVHREGAGRWT